MKLQLSLWENSKTFLEEAIAKAVQAESEPVAWKFAVLALVQAIELAMKERLEREHAVLVYANIDKPKNTVSFDGGVSRLRSIAKVQFSNADLADLERAKSWRDAIVHAEIDVNVEHLKPVFARLLGFHAEFCRRHLCQEIYSVLSGDNLSAALAIKEYGQELMGSVEKRLAEEHIELTWVWACRSCGFDSFVVQDEINTCYLCGEQEDVITCDDCQDPVYADETEEAYPLGKTWLNPSRLCRRCYIRNEERLRERSSCELEDQG